MTSWTGPGGIAAKAADAWWGVPTRKANLPQAAPYTPQHEGACLHGVSPHLPAAGRVPAPGAGRVGRLRGGRPGPAGEPAGRAGGAARAGPGPGADGRRRP